MSCWSVSQHYTHIIFKHIWLCHAFNWLQHIRNHHCMYSPVIRFGCFFVLLSFLYLKFICVDHLFMALSSFFKSGCNTFHRCNAKTSSIWFLFALSTHERKFNILMSTQPISLQYKVNLFKSNEHKFCNKSIYALVKNR